MVALSNQEQFVDYFYRYLAKVAEAGRQPRLASAEDLQISMEGLVDQAEGQQEIIVQLLVQPERLRLLKDFDRLRAAQILVQVLGEVDVDGQSLNRVIRARKVDDWVAARAIHTLGERDKPALIMPLIQWMWPDGRRGWLFRRLRRSRIFSPRLNEPARALLSEIGRQQITSVRPLVEELDQAMAANATDYDGYDRVPLVTVRAQFGDLEALHLLINWAFGDEDLETMYGGDMSPQTGLDAAVDSLGGVSSVVECVAPSRPDGAQDYQLDWLMAHGDRPQIQRWARSELFKMESEIALDHMCRQLGSEEWSASNSAAYALRSCYSPTHAWRWRDPLPIDRLRALAADTDADRRRRLWAVYALFAMNHDATALWEALPEAHAPVPAGVPYEVQHAIVTYWEPEPGCEYEREGSDIRLLIQGMRNVLVANGIRRVDLSSEDEVEQMKTYQSELRRVGLTDATVSRAKGIECYHVRGRQYEFYLSAAGPFCCETWPTFYSAERHPLALDAPTLQMQEKLAQAGLLWLTGPTLDTTFEQYFISFVRIGTPLTVRDLLFFNQYDVT